MEMENTIKEGKETAVSEPTERRVYGRVPLPLTIGVSILAAEDEYHVSATGISCRGRDISGGGISFYGATRYANGNILRIRIALPGKAASPSTTEGTLLQVMGNVMWSKKDSDSESYVTGVQFLNIYEDDFGLLNEYVQDTKEN